MRHFMAGFFLVFSFFKFLDAPGFASAFKMYDPLAKAIPGWSWIYPYVELLLGVAYVMSWQPLATNVTTLVLMSVGGVGVLQSLLQKLHHPVCLFGDCVESSDDQGHAGRKWNHGGDGGLHAGWCASPMPNAPLASLGIEARNLTAGIGDGS